MSGSKIHRKKSIVDSHYLPEPYKIRVVEPLKRTNREERENALIEAGYNPFLLSSDKVFIDLLTDSGTGAITQEMQAAMLKGDEAYSGSRSYRTLSKTVQDIFGYQFTIPTHQGRGAEQLYVPALINKRERDKGLERDKMVAISNYFFDTTQGHAQYNGCRIQNVPSPNAFNTEVKGDFKGNFDLNWLSKTIEKVGAKNIPYIVSTITCNSAGGQPVSIENLKAVYEIAQSYDIPVVMDCARFAENAYFVKQREVGYTTWTIQEITHEAFKYADLFSMSAKKDALVPMGGLLSFKDDRYLDVQLECKTLCVLLEGFPTYGGLEGGAMERLAVGLYDGMDYDWLASRVQQIEYLVNGLEFNGIRCQQAGGHAAFIDAGALLPHIPPEQFPGHALACELYLVAGIRGAEIGSLLQGCDSETGKQLPCPAELLRLALPRATYTQAHLDYVIAAFKEVKDRASSISGLKFVYEPKVLRHFNAKLAPIS